MRKFRSGFTIVELTIYMALLAVFLVIMTQILVSILDLQLESQATSFVEQDSRYILSRLAYDINRADVLTDFNPPGETRPYLWLFIDPLWHIYYLDGNELRLVTSPPLVNRTLNSSETNIQNLTGLPG